MMPTPLQLAADPVMHRIIKSINATAGQHLRAIRKGFAEAGAPVTGTVEPEAQRRIPLVSEGTNTARRIIGAPAACAGSGCNAPQGECLGFCTGAAR